MTYLQHSDPTVPYYRVRRGCVGALEMLTAAAACRASGRSSGAHSRRSTARSSVGSAASSGMAYVVQLLPRAAGKPLTTVYPQIAHDHVAHHFFVGVPFCRWPAYSLGGLGC